jgi:hypothetical protein
MGKYAQLVIGPAGCGKVRLQHTAALTTQMHSAVGFSAAGADRPS